MNAEILRISGWTVDDITRLVTDRLCPDHWYNDPRPTFALMEAIRVAIDDSDNLSYRKDFVDIIKSMGLKEPKVALAGLLSKIKRRVANAVKQNNLMMLCEEMTELSGKGQEIVGPFSQELGITPQWLQGKDVLADDVIVSNGIIAELFQYRRRHNIGWKTVTNDWWCKLFPLDDNIPLTSTVLSNWGAVDRKKQLLIRDRPTKEKDDFLNKKYVHPTTKPPRSTEQNMDNVQQVDSDDSSSDADEGYTSEISVSPYMLRRHGDTIAILHELLEQEKQENNKLSQKLVESELKLCEAETRAYEAECSSREAENAKAHKDDEIAKLTKEHKKQCSRYERELKKAANLSRELNKEMTSLKSANVTRRLATRNAQLEYEKEKVSKLEKDIEKLHQVIKELRRTKRNRTEQIRYNVNKCALIEEKFEIENQSLKRKLQELEIDNDSLRSELDGIMADKHVATFEDGAYMSDIRVVCYELISRGVGSKHVSDIIRLVLQRVAGLDCGKLPKPTCIRYMAFEQALLSKHVAKEAIENAQHPVTMQTDGTSKKHVPYVAMLASTDSGTFGLGLTEVETENSEILLEETISAIEQLLSISDIAADEEAVTRLLLKVKNTMTDRCVVNKKFVELLEEWRERTVPKVTRDWDKLSPELKKSMTTINDLYCGKHLVLNLQEYAGAALNDWESVEAGGGKVGREKHIPWSRKESATFLAIRSVCEAFGPDSNAQAGCPIEFNDYVREAGKTNEMQAYRGNRFNVPFENGGAVYFHHQQGHIKAVHNNLPQNKQKNQLIRSVMYDLDDKIVVGGIRAVGIINAHITSPLMKMLGKQEISVMNTTQYYTRLHECVSKWMKDPQELLDDSAVMFDDILPHKDHIHEALYAHVDEDVAFNTKQALSIILHNMYVCITRQVEDHLPGGKYHNPVDDVIQETKTCPKDNVAAERVFAGLDYLKRKSPNISALAMQGILLWSMNKTAIYLNECCPSKREELVKKAIKCRKNAVALYQAKKQKIKENRREALEKRLQEKEARERELGMQIVSNTENVLKLCGFICKTRDDVERLLNTHSAGTRKSALIAQIRYYKCVNRGVVKGSLFFMSSEGKPLSESKLSENLKEILHQFHTTTPSTSVGTSASLPHDKIKARAELKEKLLAKLNRGSTTKRKCPFPAESVVGKKIRHTCLSLCGEKLVNYMGTVLRESTPSDIEELMEDEYKSYLDRGYTFYTVTYDPPYDQQFVYPLKKEWDDNLLKVL